MAAQPLPLPPPASLAPLQVLYLRATLVSLPLVCFLGNLIQDANQINVQNGKHEMQIGDGTGLGRDQVDAGSRLSGRALSQPAQETVRPKQNPKYFCSNYNLTSVPSLCIIFKLEIFDYRR